MHAQLAPFPTAGQLDHSGFKRPSLDPAGDVRNSASIARDAVYSFGVAAGCMRSNTAVGSSEGPDYSMVEVKGQEALPMVLAGSCSSNVSVGFSAKNPISSEKKKPGRPPKRDATDVPLMDCRGSLMDPNALDGQDHTVFRTLQEQKTVAFMKRLRVSLG